MSYLDFIEEVKKAEIPFIQNESGTRLTTSATGGSIAILLQPNNVEQLVACLKILNKFKMNPKILGNGSNLLLPDLGISDFPIIKLGKGFKFSDINGEFVEVGASTYFPTVSREMGKAGLSGLEFAGGIPASIGGAVRMNAGAHGSEIGNVISEISGVTTEGELVTLKQSDVQWSYRHSSLPSNIIVTAVKLKLNTKPIEEIESLHRRFLDDRKSHQPLQFASFGSVFKNPEGLQGSAGKLIESVGLKGYQIGNAMISGMHANWIINPNKTATTADMVALIEHARLQVKLQCGIDLEPEVIRW